MRTPGTAALALSLASALALTCARAHAQDEPAGEPGRAADPAGQPEPAPPDAPPAEGSPTETPAEPPADPTAGDPAAGDPAAGDPAAAPPEVTPAALTTSPPPARPAEPRAVRQRTAAEDEAEAAAMMDDVGGVGIPLRIDAPEGLAVHVSSRPRERGVRLCLGPCTTRVARGTYYFGVGFEDGGAAMDPEPRPVLDATRLRIGFENRGALRTIGGVVLGAALAMGITSIVGVVVETNRDAAFAYLGVGIGGIALFAGVSLPLLFLNDSLSVVVDPPDATP